MVRHEFLGVEQRPEQVAEGLGLVGGGGEVGAGAGGFRVRRAAAQGAEEGVADHVLGDEGGRRLDLRQAVELALLGRELGAPLLKLKLGVLASPLVAGQAADLGPAVEVGDIALECGDGLLGGGAGLRGRPGRTAPGRPP